MKYAALRERIRDLEACLAECAQDLEWRIDDAYPAHLRAYPSSQAPYHADMSIVRRANALLNPNQHASTTSATPERTEGSDADARQG